MKKRMTWLALLLLFALPLHAAEVKEAVSKQVGNRVLFTYDLIGDEAEAEVDVTISVGGKTYKPSELHLEGAFGKVRSGRGKELWWNVLQDFPRGLDGEVDWKITAGGKMFVSPTTRATFVSIPAGQFTMGSPANEPGRFDNETQHRVTISRPFYLQTTEVTQGQWKSVMGNNPSYFKNCGDDCPVEQVTWNDVQEFIHKLNDQERTDKYRLPTEAEWEYAVRAGTATKFYWGDQDDCLKANYGNSSFSSECKGSNPGKTIRVGNYPPNAWGLYDMHGNVWEWVQDWYGNYPTGSVTDPEGPSSGSRRVGRGGSWPDDARGCRSANRGDYTPAFRSIPLGFRLARTP